MPEQWIHIRNWDRFQHYEKRRPIWIKVYTELLDDPNFMGLSHTERSVLLGLWLQYARSRRALLADTRRLTRAMNVNVTRKTLESLNHAGFITLSASKVLAPRARSQETEKEKEQVQDQKPASQAVVQYAAELESFASILGRQAGFPQAGESEDEPWS